MRVIVVFLAVAAAASAAPSVAPVAPPAPTLIDVYRAPLADADYNQPEEDLGLAYLLDRPFVVAFQKNEEEVAAYFLEKGAQTIYENKKMEFLRKHLLSNTEKVALYMSAARYLQIPQLTMPIKMLVPPAQKPVSQLAPVNTDVNSVGDYIPFVFVVPKATLADELKELYKAGQFAFTDDNIQTLQQ